MGNCCRKKIKPENKKSEEEKLPTNKIADVEKIPTSS